jgi:predicted metal-binding membrane protein
VTEIAQRSSDVCDGWAGMARLLARPRAIAFACIAVLTTLGWAALGLMAADTGSDGAAGSWLDVICRATSLSASGSFSVRIAELGLVFGMWAAMVLVMMLPTAGPMILTYAEIAETAGHKSEPIVSPFALIAGYLVVWLGFALVASLLQIAASRAGVFELPRTVSGALVSAAMLLAAGLYQFSPLKHACLTQCQRPLPFFFAHWKTSAGGVFGLGLRQGAFCLGCCWALMLLMLTAGAMNMVWAAVLGVIMTVEKLTTSARFSRGVGLILVLLGFGFLLSAGSLVLL